MPIVEVPGYGEVEFPDSMSNQDIEEAIRKNILKPEPSLGNQLKRQAALTARAAVEGLTALPALMAEPLRMGLNLIPGVDFPPQQQAVSGLLTKAGLPKPETPTERVAAAGSQALMGAGAGLGIGKGLMGLEGQMARGVGQRMTALPGAQATSAMASGGAGQIASEYGAGPAGQLLTSLVAGTVAPMAGYTTTQGIKGVGRGAKAAIEPFTKTGREKAVGGALRRLSLDDRRAMAEMEKAAEIIPGSKPTVGITSKDYGLAAAERTMRSKQPAQFAERAAEQNIARVDYLDKLANAPLQKATARRDKALDLLNIAMDKNPPVNVKPVIDRIDDILAGPSGKRQAVRTSLEDIRKSLFDESGTPETRISNVYGSRQNIGDKFDKKAMQDPTASQYRVAKREVMQVKEALDQELGKSSPEFMEYLKVYARQSKPINQIEAARKLKERAVTSATDFQGEYFITPGKWKTHFESKRSELSKILSPQQMKNMGRITKDIDRGNALAAIKSLGSDTVQNLSVSHIIGRALSAKEQPSNAILRTLERPLNFLYRVPDDMAEELLADAMLDPKLAVELMQKATPKRMESIANILSKRLESYTYGAAIGTAGQEQ